MTKRKATMIGLCAVILWSTMVGLVRTTTETLGPVGGPALIYTAGSAMLFFTVGFPKLKTFPRTYLIIGSILFAAYEILLTLSLGFAANGRQAIEVSMMNYLWPSLTILFAVIFNRQKANLLLLPGICLALYGVSSTLAGDAGIDIAGILANIKDNPVCYGMSLAAAFVWAVYCTVTSRMADGKNGITFFFIVTGIAFWCMYLFSDQPPLSFSLRGVLCLLGASAGLGFGAAAWNVGMLKGNVTVLATSSYFIPVLSALMASVLLSATLSGGFWIGALMVCGGSLLCWISTRSKEAPAEKKAE